MIPGFPNGDDWFEKRRKEMEEESRVMRRFFAAAFVFMLLLGCAGLFFKFWLITNGVPGLVLF